MLLSLFLIFVCFQVRLDSVASSRDGQAQGARNASLSGPSITSQWGAGESDEEGSPSRGGMSMYNGSNVVGGASVASSNRARSKQSGRSGGGGGGGGLLRLPSTDHGQQRPKTGADPYVLRGGFKMPRQELATSSSTSFLPDVYNN